MQHSPKELMYIWIYFKIKKKKQQLKKANIKWFHPVNLPQSKSVEEFFEKTLLKPLCGRFGINERMHYKWRLLKSILDVRVSRDLDYMLD